MKTLKFESYLADKIKKGEKTTTWRLFDDKDLSVGDEVQFINKMNAEVFGRARLTDVRVKPFSALDESDLEGHEDVGEGEAMYSHYSGLYKREVTPEELVKVIRFVFQPSSK